MKLYDGGILMIAAITMVVLGTGAVVGGAAMDNPKSVEPEHRVIYRTYEEASYAETPECIEYKGYWYCE